MEQELQGHEHEREQEQEKEQAGSRRCRSRNLREVSLKGEEEGGGGRGRRKGVKSKRARNADRCTFCEFTMYKLAHSFQLYINEDMNYINKHKICMNGEIEIS
eukprot:650922-Hanusia_phi.AAC.1